jgi:hypothetical protein
LKWNRPNQNRLPDNAPEQVGFYTINTPVSDMDDSFIGRQLANFMKKKINNLFAGQEDTPIGLMMTATAREAPLRTMLMVGDGSVTRDMLDALLTAINGRFFKGLAAFMKAIWANRK